MSQKHTHESAIALRHHFRKHLRLVSFEASTSSQIRVNNALISRLGFEQAEENGFWNECVSDMKGKMNLFNDIWRELDMPYSEPEGGYFVVVNMSKVTLPENYPFPPHVQERLRDFKLAWFLIQELGVAAIPPSEFYSPANQHIGEQWMRFAVCKPDSVLEAAKERLRGLKAYIY